MGFLLNNSGNADHPAITFLFKLVSGVEPRSYGVNVARLAQLPPTVIGVAEAKASQLESAVWNRVLATLMRSLLVTSRATEYASDDLLQGHRQLQSAVASRRH